MLRDYLPIPLIPAAWILTFATIVAPEIDTYWIQHMNLFITLFLGGFGAVSWKKMSEDKVLKIWRKVILIGFLFTAFGAAAFYLDIGSTFFLASVVYWFAAPGAAFYATSKELEESVTEFKAMAYFSAVLTILFIYGSFTETVLAIAASLIGVGLVQTVSILLASRMDKGWMT